MAALLSVIQMHGRAAVAVGRLLLEQMQQQELLETAVRERRHLFPVVALLMLEVAAAAFKDQIKQKAAAVRAAVARGQEPLR